MECPHCHAPNLDGATKCHTCAHDLPQSPSVADGDARVTDAKSGSEDQFDLLGEPTGADGRGRTANWILVSVALAAVVVIAAVVITAGAGGSGGSAGASTSPDGSLSVSEQAQLLDSVGRGLDQSAQRYQAVLVDADEAAVENADALKAWSREWTQRQADYRAEVAAVKAYNSRQQATPARSVPIIEKRTVGTGKDERTVERIVGYESISGSPPQYKDLPSPPSRPAKIDASDQELTTRLTAVAKSLDRLQQRLSDSAVDPVFAQTATDAQGALELLRERVREARRAVRHMVRREKKKGDVVLAARLSPLSLQGIGDAIHAVRMDLRNAGDALGLPEEDIAWASR